jgi:hypothetical protein
MEVGENSIIRRVMASLLKSVPIYTTKGDLGGYLSYPYIFNPQGEWIGWVTEDRTVYTVNGVYVGWLSMEPRILRKQSGGFGRARLSPPLPPSVFLPPPTVPLAPLMAELPSGVFDVLDEEPDLMPCLDFGVFSEELD